MILVVSSRIEPSNRESTCFPTSITTSFLIKLVTNLDKNAGIINRNRNNSASCTDNKRITLKISEIRKIAI